MIKALLTVKLKIFFKHLNTPKGKLLTEVCFDCNIYIGVRVLYEEVKQYVN